MSQDNNASTRMEFNGIPLYVKSDGEKGIPYLYDVDTNEHVGYWCQCHTSKKCLFHHEI